MLAPGPSMFIHVLGVFMRFWIVAALSATILATPVFANIGRIKSTTGSAFAERAGQRLPLKSGLVIELGDTIVTGSSGRMGMTFIDNSRMAAGPNSRIIIRTFDFNDTTQRGRFLTEIDKGQVAIVSGLIARSGPDAMQVKTPKSLFAVRGARIVVRVK